MHGCTVELQPYCSIKVYVIVGIGIVYSPSIHCLRVHVPLYLSVAAV
jgi:hypothetical protein